MASNRSQLIKKNILFSFGIKGWAGVIQILLVPLTIKCLGNYANGIWMVISSMLIWIDSMDIGLGNGLRNILADKLAKGDMAGAKTCVSTTFFTLIGIILPVVCIATILCNAINIYQLLNVDPQLIPHLSAVVSVSVIIVGGTFIFKFIGNVYMALQLPAVNNALVTIGQTLTLISVFCMQQAHFNSLMWVAIAYTAGPLLSYLVAYPISFRGKYAFLRPGISAFKACMIKDLFSLGIKFFILQIAGIILFASTNLIISKLFSPELVTPYQVTYRYYSFTVMIFTVIAVPFWSATTDAYATNDMQWIKKSMRKLHIILAGMLLAIVLQTLASPYIYKIWVGEGVRTNLMLSCLMGIYIFEIICSLCYSYILNGMGALNVQLVTTMSAAILYLPLAWFWGKVYGVDGVAIALIIVNMPGTVINCVQYKKIISGNASPMWRK